MRAPVLLSPFNTWQSETPFFEGWREHDPGALIRGKVRSFFVGSSELNSSPASHDPPQGLCQRRSSFWSERGLCLLLSSPGTRKRDEPEYSSTIRSGLIQLLRESSWSSKAWASTFKSFVMESDTCKLDLRLRSIWEDSLMNVLLSPSERLMIFRVWGGGSEAEGSCFSGGRAEMLLSRLRPPNPRHLFLQAGALLRPLCFRQWRGDGSYTPKSRFRNT